MERSQLSGKSHAYHTEGTKFSPWHVVKRILGSVEMLQVVTGYAPRHYTSN